MTRPGSVVFPVSRHDRERSQCPGRPLCNLGAFRHDTEADKSGRVRNNSDSLVVGHFLTGATGHLFGAANDAES